MIYPLDLPAVVVPEEPMTYMGDFERVLEQRLCHLFGGHVIDEENAVCVENSLCGHLQLATLYPGHPMTTFDGDARCVCGNPICPDCLARRSQYNGGGDFVPLPEVKANG